MSVCWRFLTSVCSCAYRLSQLARFISLSGIGFHKRVIDIIWLEVRTQWKSKLLHETWRMTHSICDWKFKSMVYFDASISKKVQLSSFFLFFFFFLPVTVTWSHLSFCNNRMLIYNFEVNCEDGMISENDEVMLSAVFLTLHVDIR